jgi:predicted dithiol-disulfide oxidoreductase (DUF899 family)
MTAASTPPVVSRSEWLAEIDTLRAREKAHTREGDAIAAARRRLPMTEVDPSTPLVGANGELPLIDAFEGRTQLFASFHMWHDGRPAAEQCEGCTFFTGQVRELSYLHQRDVTFAASARGPTRSPTATAASWAGRCPGTPYPPRPTNGSSPVATSA